MSFQIEYLDLEQVTKKFSPEITLMRKYFLNTQPLNSSKYWDEVFHIGMVYHRIFPFDRIIVLDIDLKFTVDIALLEMQFYKMNKSNLIAIGYDLAPHYWYDFREFRLKNPGTLVGQPRPGLQVHTISPGSIILSISI